MKSVVLVILFVLFLSSCGSQLPVVTAQQWIDQSEAKLKRVSKIKGPKDDAGRTYYCYSQKANIPKEKSKVQKNKSTKEEHYGPPSGGGKYEVETRYYVEDGRVVSWNMIYSSILD